MEKFQKIKRILVICVLSLLSVSLLTSLIIGMIYGTQYLSDYRKDIAERRLFETLSDSLIEHEFYSYHANGVIRMKAIPSERRISYKMTIYPDNGYTFSDLDGGVVLKFIDEDLLVVSKWEFKNSYVTLKDDEGYNIGRKYDGAKYVDIDNFIMHKTVEVAHSIGVYPKSKLVNEFESTMKSWTRKAKNIQVGMTYDKMVKFAGKPRKSAKVTSKEEYLGNYDKYKYNYGELWVYFKDGLVYTIKNK